MMCWIELDCSAMLGGAALHRPIFYMRAFGLRRAGNSRNEEVWFQNPLPSCHTLVRRKTLKCSFWISFWNHCHLLARLVIVMDLTCLNTNCQLVVGVTSPDRPASQKRELGGSKIFQVPFRLRCDPQQSQPLVGFAMKGPQQGQSHVEPEQQY